MTEAFAIVVVAIALRRFLEPLFDRLREALGVAGHSQDSVRAAGGRLAKISLVLFVLDGVLHTMLPSSRRSIRDRRPC